MYIQQLREEVLSPILIILGICKQITILSTSNKIVSNNLLSKLSPYRDEIIEDHKCGFRRNRSTTDQIFCIRQLLEKR
jgi:hypothetical protein